MMYNKRDDQGHRLVIRERCMSQISSFDHVLITRYHTNCILYSNQSFRDYYDHMIVHSFRKNAGISESNSTLLQSTV